MGGDAVECDGVVRVGMIASPPSGDGRGGGGDGEHPSFPAVARRGRAWHPGGAPNCRARSARARTRPPPSPRHTARAQRGATTHGSVSPRAGAAQARRGRGASAARARLGCGSAPARRCARGARDGRPRVLLRGACVCKKGGGGDNGAARRSAAFAAGPRRLAPHAAFRRRPRRAAVEWPLARWRARRQRRARRARVAQRLRRGEAAGGPRGRPRGAGGGCGCVHARPRPRSSRRAPRTMDAVAGAMTASTRPRPPASALGAPRNGS